MASQNSHIRPKNNKFTLNLKKTMQKTPGKTDLSSSSTHSLKTDSEEKHSRRDEPDSDESPQSRPNDASNWNQSVYSGTEL